MTLRRAVIGLIVVCVCVSVVAIAAGATVTGVVGLVAPVLACVAVFGGRRRSTTCGAVPPRSFGSDREHWRCTLDRSHAGSHRYYDQRGLQP